MENSETNRPGDFLPKLYAVLRRDSAIYALTLLIFVIVGCVAYLNDAFRGVNFISYAQLFYEGGVLTGVIVLAAYFIVLVKERNPRPTKAILDRARIIFRYPEEVVGFVIMMLMMSVFMSSYTSAKVMIPMLNGYKYDMLFTEIDRWLHFGVDPWRLTHALFSHPLLTGVINFFYNLWFFVFWGVWIYFMVRVRPNHDRQQFLISFILCWMIIGGFLAVTMSSVGPCYYAHIIDTPDPFAPLMDHLHAQQNWLLGKDIFLEVWALDTQSMLWDNYMAKESAIGSGISAMPSMHVSVATLLALGINRLSRKWGYVFWGYAAMIQLGSVHLAWHYAIDGYLSILLTILIWKIVGRLLPQPKTEVAAA